MTNGETYASVAIKNSFAPPFEGVHCTSRFGKPGWHIVSSLYFLMLLNKQKKLNNKRSCLVVVDQVVELYLYTPGKDANSH